MENTTQEKKIENQKVPLRAKITILAGVLLILFRTLIWGHGATIVDYLFQVLGGIVAIVVMSLIPYIVIKNSSWQTKWTVFSVSFLLISIITLLGAFYRNI